MITEILVWIIFGGIAGWIASIITRTNDQLGLVGNIVVGIIGAILGGFLVGLLGGPRVDGFNVTSFVVALIGAVVLLLVVKMVSRRRV